MDEIIVKPGETYLKIFVLCRSEEDEIKAYSIYHGTCFLHEIVDEVEEGSKLECEYEDGTKLFSFRYYRYIYRVEEIWQEAFGKENVRVWDNYLDMFD